MKRAFACIILSAFTFAQNAPQRPEAQSFAARTANLQRHDGFIPFYFDARRGDLLLELSPQVLERQFLYFTGLGSGVGSLDMAADRSSFGPAALCEFRRAGNRVLLIQRNEGFRAENGSADLKRSVELSFPTSVLVSLTVEAEQDGKLLVNANPMILRDAVGLLDQLRQPQRLNAALTQQRPAAAGAAWRLDDQRSIVDMDHTRTFPLNTEMEGMLTFISDTPSGGFNQPNAHALTVREHHSLVALPEAGYEVRERDPRIGFFGGNFWDFSQKFNEPPIRRLVNRWRLQKKDPSAAMSEPVKPIVFYLDPAIAEPLRSWVRKGALWWNDAFAQAGFKNALRVEDLPADADPMDVRYPTIQWTNRSGRGWSVGQSHADPRTGEIIHAVVQLDSHRMRTVHNYWASTLAPEYDEDAFDLFAPLDAVDPRLSEEESMLRRLALLTCHEMGHVLGLAHNFAASTFGRGSVMDYYAPRIAIRADGTPDLSDAYMQGVGSYDKLAIEWGYSTDINAKLEKTRLNAIVQRGIQQGVVWANTEDPRWNSYDDGPDPVTWLKQVIPVRAALLKNYGERNVQRGEPWADLTSRFALIYAFHQYALGAAVNVIGSAKIPLALKGDTQDPVKPWPAAQQREALQMLMSQLQPATLEVRPDLWKLLAPVPNEGGDPERFRSSAGYVFNPSDAARFVCEIVVGGLLEPARLTRLRTLQHADPGQLGPREVVDALVRAAFPAGAGPGLAEVVQTEVTERLMRLAVDENATGGARAMGWYGVDAVEQAVKAGLTTHPSPALRYIAREIELFRRDPKSNVPHLRPSGAPVGPPI